MVDIVHVLTLSGRAKKNRKVYEENLKKFLQWMGKIRVQMYLIFYEILFRSKKHFFEDPLLISISILLSFTVIIYLLIEKYPELGEGYKEGVFVEFTGMLFDIFVFAIFIQIFLRMKNKRDEIKRQYELIDDYKNLNSKEAKFRIAGAIRRLNRLGIIGIDLVGIRLEKFNFISHQIKDLSGTVFNPESLIYYQKRMRIEPTNISKNLFSILIDVDFSNTICKKVLFGGKNTPGTTKFYNCMFVDTDLTGATFQGAQIRYGDNIIPEGTYTMYSNGGRFISSERCSEDYIPSFCGADLSGVNFEEALLINVDFRAAKNIEKAVFKDCIGLETCLFDIDIDKFHKKTGLLDRYSQEMIDYIYNLPKNHD